MVVKKRRVFTEILVAPAQTVAGGAAAILNSYASYVAQEDIEVVGVELTIMPQGSLGNDGFCVAVAELSQAGQYNADGVVLQATMTQSWNTAPAFGDERPVTEIIVFPDGDAVPVREEGTLNLHLQLVATDLTAGNFVVGVTAVIYYVKKGS